MITTRFRESLQEFHRKKWFPGKYPDPFGEFIDYVSEGMLEDLRNEFEKTPRHSYAAIGYYIYRLLPDVQFNHLLTEYQQKNLIRTRKLETTSQFILYHLRALSVEDGDELWNEYKRWSTEAGSVMFDWLHARWKFYATHYNPAVVFLPESPLLQLHGLEEMLRTTRDLFDWHIQKRAPITNIPQLLRSFRMTNWDDSAAWSDLTGFARSTIRATLIAKEPTVQQTLIDDGLILAFPIEPPNRVLVEAGKGAGPIDFLRLIYELAKAFFFSGVDSELPTEERIAGDPALAPFWGFLYSHALATEEGLSALIKPNVRSLAPDLNLFLQWWLRYDLMLLHYRMSLPAGLNDAQQIYETSFKAAFTLEFPQFLYLPDMEKCEESEFRVVGHFSAIAALDTIRTLYGNRWFSVERCVRRLREYWHEGYKLTLRDVLTDLQVTVPLQYPFV